MAQASFKVDDEIHDRVDDRLVQGQAKSVWYRYSAETMMAVDTMLDDVLEPYQYDERQEFIEAAVRKEVERQKNQVDNGSDS